MSTIKDVARRAGVSVSTVSNVINNRSSVSLELYNRVQNAMKELQYRPSILARNLRKNQMKIIGVIFWNMKGYAGVLLETMLHKLHSMGCSTDVCIAYEDGFEIKEAVNRMIGSGVSGIIICSPFIDHDVLNDVDFRAVPILLLDYCLERQGVLTLEYDNEGLVHDVTRRLLAAGEDVGLITGRRGFGCEESCIKGYEKACAKAGVRAACHLEMPFHHSRLFEELLESFRADAELPRSWIVSSEYMASCVRGVMDIRGRRDYRLYVLSGDGSKDFDESCVVKLKRNAAYYAGEAVNRLFRQIQEPFESDAPSRITAGGDETKETSAPVQSFRKKRIRVLLPDAPMNKSIQLLCSDFTNKTGIQVEIVVKNMTEMLDEIIASCGDPRRSHDVVAFHINWLKDLGQRKILRPLDEIMDFNGIMREYHPKVRNVYKKRPYSTLGIPAEMGIQILAYRDDLLNDPLIQKQFFNSVGMELRKPRSWSEFNIISRFFTREYNPVSPTKYGTCIAGHVPIGLIEEFWPRCGAFMGKLGDSKSFNLAGRASVRALENLCDSYRYSYPDCQSFMDIEQVNQLLSGDIAMVVTYNSYIMMNRRVRERHIRICDTPSNMTVIDSYLLGIPVGTEAHEEAAAFIRWCCSDDIAEKSLMLGRMLPKERLVYRRELEQEFMDMRGVFDHLDLTVCRDDIFGPVLQEEKEKMIADGLARAVYGGENARGVLEELQLRMDTGI